MTCLTFLFLYCTLHVYWSSDCLTSPALSSALRLLVMRWEWPCIIVLLKHRGFWNAVLPTFSENSLHTEHVSDDEALLSVQRKEVYYLPVSTQNTYIRGRGPVECTKERGLLASVKPRKLKHLATLCGTTCLWKILCWAQCQARDDRVGRNSSG